MLNKKKLGLGMVLIGGVVTIAGAVIAGRVIKEEKAMDKAIEDEFSNFIDEEISECDDCPVVNEEHCKVCKDEEKEALTESIYKLEPTVENVIEARKSTSIYNPHATPTSISQEELECLGSTF